jgi:hypothetical protein
MGQSLKRQTGKKRTTSAIDLLNKIVFSSIDSRIYKHLQTAFSHALDGLNVQSEVAEIAAMVTENRLRSTMRG